MNFRAKFKPEPVGFQLAPMIDLVFQLLSFFLMSQMFTVWEKNLEIRLPTADTSITTRRLPGELIINVRPGGAVEVNGRVLDDVRLRQTLSDLVKLNKGHPVIIRADKTTDYEHIVHVLDLCRQSEIWNISFATALPQNK